MDAMRSQGKATATFLAFLTVLGGMVSCSSDDDGGGVPAPTFEPFVIELFDATGTTTEPTPINDIDFTFGDDPAAFDALLD